MKTNKFRDWEYGLVDGSAYSCRPNYERKWFGTLKYLDKEQTRMFLDNRDGSNLIDYETPLEGLESNEWRLARPEEILPEYGGNYGKIWAKLPIVAADGRVYTAYTYKKITKMKVFTPEDPFPRGIAGLSLLWIKR
jgi:hypothetical protein